MNAVTLQVTPSVNAGEDHAMQLRFELTEILCEEMGFTEPDASLTAEALVDGMRKRMGAGWRYIPAPDKEARNDAIRAKFNGRNLREVCLEFNVSENTVRRVSRRA